MRNNITGMDVYYYMVCLRKLWYFHNEIQMEQDNENVKIGRILDEQAYKNEEKHINIDGTINIDFIKSEGVLHEIKKSRKIEEAGVMQIKYYLYYLKKKGVSDIIGKIDYPLLKKTLTVELNEDDEKNMEKIFEDIRVVTEKNVPPPLEKKRICKACAYHDICFI